MRGVGAAATLAAGLVLALGSASRSGDDLEPTVPENERGRSDAERSGIHDASNIRTVFWNYGMVGDYPPDPIGVDLSVFHSAEVPKGSGMNYSDGVTPFVLAKVMQNNGLDTYIMETGFRERQGVSPQHNRVMRFEPRPGFFEPNPVRNPARSPAISSDPRTWPASWPDKRSDLDDPGWAGSWNGYFGKQIVADQESFMVMDDNFYDAWDFTPDTRDPTRHGLGLRVEVRGFQWSNPQARNVIFWHYDITNESTTDYDDNIIFGLYMDSGVGGSTISCDGIAESDDDSAFFDREFDERVINLVYTWDRFNHGRNLSSGCGTTGYLGYAYLETPGNFLDGVDNDEDGITDETRDTGPGTLLDSPGAIDAYLFANYDVTRFEATYGPLADRPAVRGGRWWTGDEDLDWVAELHDTGADGLSGTGDAGEGDGVPTEGEPNVDRTDLNESDQIGLTGFRHNRIRPGQGNPDPEVDDILFFTNNANWPQRLYEQFTDPDPDVRFSPPLAENYNIGFLFASGPFTLKAGQSERFSLALAFGADLSELRRTVQTVQQIYDSNYRFAVPPKAPTVTAEAGDGWVRLSWDDVAERSADPVTGELDFEGYRVYRSTDPEFRDVQVITTATGSGPIGNGKPIAQFDLDNDRSGFSEQSVEGVAYFLGTNSGITHTWTDYSATNGQLYYYAVTAYDYGPSAPGLEVAFYPSENAIAVSRTLRGGFVAPANVVAVRPNAKVAGYVPAGVEAATQRDGNGTGVVAVEIVNSALVPDGHVLEVSFQSDPQEVRATSYTLTDLDTGEVFFDTGTDLDGRGIGPVGPGVLPVVYTPATVQVDTAATGFVAGSSTNASLAVSYLGGEAAINVRRPGFPDDITVVFHDAVVDTSDSLDVQLPSRLPAKFEIFAHAVGGDIRLDFGFRDIDSDGTLSHVNDRIDIVTHDQGVPPTAFDRRWRLQLAAPLPPPPQPPATGDSFELVLSRPLGFEDVFTFETRGEAVDPGKAREEFAPYVVPNPYVGSASFEPERFGISGRGERRLEFRGLPEGCTIRVYTVRGELVQTLRHEGSTAGYVEWDLRTKDNLDVAPGLYIFHADGGAVGEATGKFAIIK